MKQILFLLGLITIFSILLTGGFTLKDPQIFNTLNTYVAELLDDITPGADKTLQIKALKAVTPTPSPTSTPGPLPTATPIPTTGPTSAPTPTGTACTPTTKVAVDFLLDISSSMNNPADPLDIVSPTKIEKLITTTISFSSNFQSEDLVGIQVFATTPGNVLSVGPYNGTIFTQSVNGLVAYGFTNMREGFINAKNEINRVINSYRQHKWVLILVSDGRPTRGDPLDPLANPDVVQPIKDLGVDVLTIAYGRDADPDLLQRIASTKPNSTQRYYYYAPNGVQLQNIYRDISGAIGRNCTP